MIISKMAEWFEKMVERNITYLINFILNMKKTCFIFALKYEEIFSPIQYIIKGHINTKNIECNK